MSVYEQTETDKSLNFANTARLIALAMEGMERSHEARPYWEEARDIYDINGVKAGVDECDAHLSAATD